jgi:hypothetical protein
LVEKVSRIDLSDYLPDYKGNNRNVNEVQLFLLGLFEVCRRRRDRPFFYHFTTGTPTPVHSFAHIPAVDTQNIRRVFDDCREIILEQSVKDILMT